MTPSGIEPATFRFVAQHSTLTSPQDILLFYIICCVIRQHAVALWAEGLRYKLEEGRGFDSRLCHWHNPWGRTVSLGSTQPGGKGGLCVGLTTLSPSCADCREIWETRHRGALWPCTGIPYLYLSYVMQNKGECIAEYMYLIATY